MAQRLRNAFVAIAGAYATFVGPGAVAQPEDPQAAARAQYARTLIDHISRQWYRPPSARPGVRCIVSMTQTPAGDVIELRITECNGDEAVRASVELAVIRSSPLPLPSDPAVFSRKVTVEFAPD
jgi:colicin import membrane protein